MLSTSVCVRVLEKCCAQVVVPSLVEVEEEEELISEAEELMRER